MQMITLLRDVHIVKREQKVPETPDLNLKCLGLPRCLNLRITQSQILLRIMVDDGHQEELIRR